VTEHETVHRMARRDVRGAFAQVTGHPPYDYQLELAARETPPEVVHVPTGAGKTLATLLPWLCDPAAPRRLVYALPMRSLVEQTADVIRRALLALGDDTRVHVLMGGVQPDDWAIDADRRTVIVGTIDMLLSRGLNRGYGESRFRWPVSFGLLSSDCRWICDEVQLMGPAQVTTAQLSGLRAKLGVIGRCETVWMSATLNPEGLRTVDHPAVGDVVRLSEADRSGPLRTRLEAVKRVERLDLATVPNARLGAEIGEAVLARHRPGTRSLIIVNRVALAQDVHDKLRKRAARAGDQAPRIVLLHSRFRPPERARHMAAALDEPGELGTIVVATQVVEAGVDVSSALLATETAPFSAVVQRLGRCNRAGEHPDATVLWLDRGDPDRRAAAPYDPGDLASARSALSDLLGESASPARLETLHVDERRETSAVLRRRDLVDLFDTTPDLSGSDLDIAPYIRADEERTVSVFFRDLGTGRAADAPAPRADELVSVPVGDIKAFDPWRFDLLAGEWHRLGDRRAAPGSTVMLDAARGGYDAERGWTARPADMPAPLSPGTAPEEGMDDDLRSLGSAGWVTISEHLTDALGEARALGEALDLAPAYADAVTRAAAVHDIGKAHPAFQQMLLATATPGDRPDREPGPWAKSAHGGGRHVRKHFRHELASALALRDGEPESALVRYLVAAHHGRVRLTIRPAREEERPDGSNASGRHALGVVEGDELPAVATPLGERGATVLELSEMELGGAEPSWTALACALRDAHGPFVLAYLEALVRIADWRASG
jgi:CRISPR-associated endonuclease/helicase Cas3